jgi:hypothetical protein
MSSSSSMTIEAALNAAFHIAVKSTPCALRDRLISTIVREMLPEMPLIPVSAKNTHRVLTVGSLDLLKAYVAGREEDVRRVELTNDYETQKLAREHDPEFIFYVVEFAPGRIFREDILISAALERDDLDFFLRATRDSSLFAPFCDHSTYQSLSAINHCGPRVAPELTRRLLGALAEKAPIIEEIRKDYFGREDLKAAVVLARAGLDLSAARVNAVDGAAQEVQQILEKASSAHGRMEIAGIEPDLVTTMGRPRTGQFFGLSLIPDDYRQD